jgi:hypothetical protein
MVNLFQILNQFVLPFRKNVIEKSFMIWHLFHWLKLTHVLQKHPVFVDECLLLENKCLHFYKIVDPEMCIQVSQNCLSREKKEYLDKGDNLNFKDIHSPAQKTTHYDFLNK